MGYTDAFDVLGQLAAIELVLLESDFTLDPGTRRRGVRRMREPMIALVRVRKCVLHSRGDS